MTVELFGALLAWAAGYVLACVWFPWARCRAGKCEGGKVYNGRRTAWRDCRRCGGKGKRVRYGRLIWAYFTNL